MPEEEGETINTSKPQVIAVVGPTATGKTELSVMLAQKLDGEIISADSRLIYRDFNIGTAKPTPEERKGIPHYMIDIEDPKNTYTAGRYKKDASKIIQEILDKGKVPIVVGGTGFYVKALLDGLDIPEIEPDEEYREEMYRLAEAKGNDALHSILKEIDPESAEKIHPNNMPRVIRALEVCHVTGSKFSDVQSISPPAYDVVYIGLNTMDRNALYNRINLRVLMMMERGLVNETKNLIIKYGRTTPLLKTLGYKEICDYVDGACSLNETVEKIQQNTRNFSRKQLTWFRANKDINWFYIDEMRIDEICDRVIPLVRRGD